FDGLHRRADYQHITAMRLRYVAHEGKSQANSFCVAHQRIAYPIKLLENLALLLMRNTDSVVHDFQFYRAIVRVETHSHKFSVLRIFEGIVDQIHQRSRHGLAIYTERRHFVYLLFVGEAALLDLITL